MTNVLRFHAPGPWLTRDLKECVLASDYDGMEAAWRDACERGDKAVAENAALRQRLRDWHRVADERSAEIVRLSTRLAEVEGERNTWQSRHSTLLAELEKAASVSDRGLLAKRAVDAEARLAEADAKLAAWESAKPRCACGKVVVPILPHHSTPDSAKACVHPDITDSGKCLHCGQATADQPEAAYK